MSYHDLSECTLNPTERLNEKNQIIKMLREADDKDNISEKMSETEAGFLIRITASTNVSVKQLFWLRDIKDKYL